MEGMAKLEYVYQRINLLEEKLQSLEESIEDCRSTLGKLDSLNEEVTEMLVRTVLDIKAGEIARETIERILEKTSTDEKLRAMDGAVVQLRGMAADLREKMSDLKETLDEILENIKFTKQTYEKLPKEFKEILADAAVKISKKIDEATTLNRSIIEDVLPSVVEKTVSARIAPIEDKLNRIAEEIKKSSEALNRTTMAIERIKTIEKEVEGLKQMIEKLKQPSRPRKRKYEEEEWI